MALGDVGINGSELYSGLWNSLPKEFSDKLEFMIFLSTVILMVSVAYVILLIVIKLFRLFFGSRESRGLSKINANLEEILRLMGKKKVKEDVKKEDKKGNSKKK